MKTGLWAATMIVFLIGVGCATPPAQETDNAAIKRDADKAFQDLKEEEFRRTPESEGRY